MIYVSHMNLYPGMNIRNILLPNFWRYLQQDDFIGFAAFVIHENRLHLRRIGIHPDFRSRGLGTCLMNSMLEQSDKQGVDLLDLMVQQDNLTAINLYKKFDFIVTGESTQFSVPILARDTEGFSVIPIHQYIARNSSHPSRQKILKWVGRHKPPQRFALVFLHQDQPVGFTCFSPDLPGCYPFELFDPVDDIHLLLSSLNPFVLTNKRTIKITTYDPLAVTSFQAAQTKINYRLYKMTKTLVSSELL